MTKRNDNLPAKVISAKNPNYFAKFVTKSECPDNLK